MQKVNATTLGYTKPTGNKSGSKVMFQGDFKKELQKTIGLLEVKIEEELDHSCSLDSIVSGRNSIKIRTHDDTTGSEKITNCIFRYHHDEEKYGFVNIEVSVTEVSQQKNTYYLGRFSILDETFITKSIIERLTF